MTFFIKFDKYKHVRCVFSLRCKGDQYYCASVIFVYDMVVYDSFFYLIFTLFLNFIIWQINYKYYVYLGLL